MFTRHLRQLRDGDKKWRSMEFLRCVAVLLERIGNGREKTEFPLAIHADGYVSSLTCLITCPLCLDGPGIRKDKEGDFSFAERAMQSPAPICVFEAALVMSGLLLKGQPARLQEGIDIEQLSTELILTAESTGLSACPRCGRFTSCLYGPEQPYHLKGRCRWCLDADGPAISVTLTAEHVKAIFDSASKQVETDL